MILMISATFSQGWSSFSVRTRAQQAIILTAFIPMLMDTGGNSGSQACDDDHPRHGIRGDPVPRTLFRVQWKEFRVGLIVGATLGLLAKFVLVDHLLLKSRRSRRSRSSFRSACLAVTVVLAKFIGGTLPMLAKKAKLDPAVMASPIITTIVDFLSLLV
ncbi:MAG: magnesium transporter, partial [Oscillospiraceae bacterium]